MDMTLDCLVKIVSVVCGVVGSIGYLIYYAAKSVFITKLDFNLFNEKVDDEFTYIRHEFDTFKDKTNRTIYDDDGALSFVRVKPFQEYQQHIERRFDNTTRLMVDRMDRVSEDINKLVLRVETYIASKDK